jgi:hypothetical protein
VEEKIMNRRSRFQFIALSLSALIVLGGLNVQARAANSLTTEDAKIRSTDKLVVVWTSGDRDVALKMVFMYTLNAKLNAWWDDITLIVWGASASLLARDAELQAEVAKMKEAGVVLEACIACAEMYGVTGKLRELGIDVKGMGKPLTAYIKEGRHVLTF